MYERIHDRITLSKFAVFTVLSLAMTPLHPASAGVATPTIIDATWDTNELATGDWDDLADQHWIFNPVGQVGEFPNNDFNNNKFFNVFIDGGNGANANVTLNTVDNIDSTSVRIDSLSVGTGDQLNINRGYELTIVKNSGRADSGNILNSGDININAVGGVTDLRVQGIVHLGGDGSGTVTLRDTSHSYEARILGRNLSDDALINVNNTIQGEGYIGANLMALENQVSGVIDANVSGQQFLILIDSNAQGVTNQGTLRASNGGELLVVAGDFDNDGGTVEALDGSTDIHANVLNIDGAGILDNGNWRAIEVGIGALIDIDTENDSPGISAIGTDASVELNGRNTGIRVDRILLDESLATNNGGLRLDNNRDLTTPGDFENSGANALVEIANNASLNPNGAYTQLGGTTRLDDGFLITTNGANFQGGLLEGTGGIIGDLIIAPGAIIAPALSHSSISAGWIGATDNLHLGGIFDVQIGGSTSSRFDRIISDGDVSLGVDSILKIGIFDGFLPNIGDFFDILIGDTITDLGVELDESVLPPGFEFSFDIDNFDTNSQALRLTLIDRPESQLFTGVPEPGTLALFGAGLAGLGWLRRRRDQIGSG